MRTHPLILIFLFLPQSEPTQNQLRYPPQLSTNYANSFVLSPPLHQPSKTKMLAFFTPAFWIMMIQINALTIRVVPGSQAAAPRRNERNPRMTPSHQTTQTSGTSGGAARRCRTTRADHVSRKTTSNDGASITANISHTLVSMDGNSGRPVKPAEPHNARIREISDNEVCPQCQCVLTRSEIDQNKVGRARRGADFF